MKIDSNACGPTPLTMDEISDMVERQLEVWEEAALRYAQLGLSERKPIDMGHLPTALQLNPARIISTAADTTKKGIASRPCFLCASNRPKQQFCAEWMQGWDICLNPFPILPIHFTIISKAHVPQTAPPLEMAAMAEAAPDLCIFFNGARGGASAPDHLHLQGVLKSELPILKIAETNHPVSRPGFMDSKDFGLDLPFRFISAIITPDAAGMKALVKIHTAFGIDPEGKTDRGLVNVFFWMGSEGLLHAIVVPRRRHRPHHYFIDGPDRVVVAPGAIDMTGLVITPRREDFDRIDSTLLKEIYSETAYVTELPTAAKTHFGL